MSSEWAWVGVWFCGCSTAEVERTEIPDECAHHDARLIGEPMRVDRPGPVKLGHDCWLHDWDREHGMTAPMDRRPTPPAPDETTDQPKEGAA